MIDKRQREIKDRISRYAMDLWGISDPSRMDPIVDLLLDVFAGCTKILMLPMQAYSIGWPVCSYPTNGLFLFLLTL